MEAYIDPSPSEMKVQPTRSVGFAMKTPYSVDSRVFSTDREHGAGGLPAVEEGERRVTGLG